MINNVSVTTARELSPHTAKTREMREMREKISNSPRQENTKIPRATLQKSETVIDDASTTTTTTSLEEEEEEEARATEIVIFLLARRLVHFLLRRGDAKVGAFFHREKFKCR